MFYSTHEFSKAHPDMFAALPEPYQNDSCLRFFQIKDGWCCSPEKDQEFALGVWEAMFNTKTKTWYQI